MLTSELAAAMNDIFDVKVPFCAAAPVFPPPVALVSNQRRLHGAVVLSGARLVALVAQWCGLVLGRVQLGAVVYYAVGSRHANPVCWLPTLHRYPVLLVS